MQGKHRLVHALHSRLTSPSTNDTLLHSGQAPVVGVMRSALLDLQEGQDQQCSGGTITKGKTSRWRSTTHLLEMEDEALPELCSEQAPGRCGCFPSRYASQSTFSPRRCLSMYGSRTLRNLLAVKALVALAVRQRLYGMHVENYADLLRSVSQRDVVNSHVKVEAYRRRGPADLTAIPRKLGNVRDLLYSGHTKLHVVAASNNEDFL
eukprot:1663216-Amphidinium_carterae.2